MAGLYLKLDIVTACVPAKNNLLNILDSTLKCLQDQLTGTMPPGKQLIRGKSDTLQFDN